MKTPNRKLISKRLEIVKPVEIMQDEHEIIVLTGLGLYCDSFVWPKKDIEMLKEMNKSPKGYMFRIKQ